MIDFWLVIVLGGTIGFLLHEFISVGLQFRKTKSNIGKGV